MPNDRREQVIQRILAIADGVDGVVKVFRNRDKVSEAQRPAVVVLDADEVVDEVRPGSGRPGTSPNIVAMSPEVYLMVTGDEDNDPGAQLNALRVSFLRALLGDTEMAGILGSNGEIRYEGCATALARGRRMEGEMGLGLSFRYPLKYDELA